MGLFAFPEPAKYDPGMIRRFTTWLRARRRGPMPEEIEARSEAEDEQRKRLDEHALERTYHISG